jgi:hypothetical protein
MTHSRLWGSGLTRVVLSEPCLPHFSAPIPQSKDTKGLDKALGDSPAAAAAAPAAGAVHEAYLVLTLTGGDQPRRVYLQAQQPEGALRLKDKALDGGSVALATPTTLTAQLKNTGTRASAFRVLPNDRVKISPERCKLAPDEVGEGGACNDGRKAGRQMHCGMYVTQLCVWGLCLLPAGQ